MKIGINALFLQDPTNGSGQYLLHLLHALAEVDGQNEYVLLGPKPVGTELASARVPPEQRSVGTRSARGERGQGLVERERGQEGGERGQEGGERGQRQALPLQIPFPYQVSPVPAFARGNENVEKLVWEQLTGPAAAHKVGADLFHVPYFAPPLYPRTPTVVTIQDVIPLRLPLYRSGAAVSAYMGLVARSAHKATLVITISQHAKQDIVDSLHIPAERIRVIYQAAGDEYKPVTDATTLAKARERYGVGTLSGGQVKRYIFYLGGLDQRKNVLQLVRAFARLCQQLDDPHLQLLISGNPDRQTGPLFPDPRPVAEELGVANRVLYGFVEDEDKPAMYSGASLFVFPSIYEGFGLTPLEAMSCGAPVVCSNRTSLPEVVGDAALTVDPDDTEALAQAMHCVLTDSNLRDDLRARSLQRATQFSWRKTAMETLAAYEEADARSRK